MFTVARVLLLWLVVLLCANCARALEAEQAVVEDESVLSRPARAPEITVAYGTEPEQIADIRYGKNAPEHRPLVVLIHGGFWRPAYDRRHTGPMSAALADAGWTVATIEYRRVPGKPDLTLQDVSRAVETLPSLVKRHNGNVVLIGHSAGGHLVLFAAASLENSSIAGVLALAPVADLQLSQQRELGNGAVLAFLGLDAKERKDADPKLLPSPQARVVIVHGALDEIVPLEISRSYVASHPRARLAEVAGAGHFAVIDPASAAWPQFTRELSALSN